MLGKVALGLIGSAIALAAMSGTKPAHDPAGVTSEADGIKSDCWKQFGDAGFSIEAQQRSVDRCIAEATIRDAMRDQSGRMEKVR